MSEQGWAKSQAGVSGEVHKRESLGDMAFIWWGVRMLVEVMKDESRD